MEWHRGIFGCNNGKRKKYLFQKSIKIYFIFLEFIFFFNMTLTKVYCNMDNLKFDNINVEYGFMFKVHS
jgi:hypothetical protein